MRLRFVVVAMFPAAQAAQKDWVPKVDRGRTFPAAQAAQKLKSVRLAAQHRLAQCGPNFGGGAFAYCGTVSAPKSAALEDLVDVIQIGGAM